MTDDERRALDELCARWWEHYRLSRGNRSQRKALELGEPVDICSAADVVAEHIGSGGVQVIQLIVALIETAPDGAAIAYVGAGPLEELVHEHGDSLIDDLDRVARQSPIFREAMASVWLTAGVLEPAVERRLRAWCS